DVSIIRPGFLAGDRGEGRQVVLAEPGAEGRGGGDAGARVPDLDLAVGTACEQVLAVGAEGHAPHLAEVTAERVRADAGLQVPDARRGVPGGARQAPAAGAEGDGADTAAMAAHLPDHLARLQVPDANTALAAGRGQAFAVGAERRLADLQQVPGFFQED